VGSVSYLFSFTHLMILAPSSSLSSSSFSRRSNSSINLYDHTGTSLWICLSPIEF